MSPRTRNVPRPNSVSFRFTDLDELAKNLVAIDALTQFERQQQPEVRLRRTKAVDARHAGHDDDVASFEE